jgi:ribA/ribD-fused uncharacterized protein
MSISPISSSALSSSSKAAQSSSVTLSTKTGIKTEMIAQNFFQRHAFAISLALGTSTAIATFQSLGVSAVALGAAVTIAIWASIKFFSSSSSAVSVKNLRVESPVEFEKAFLQALPSLGKNYGFIPFYHKDVTDASLKTWGDRESLYWATSLFGNFYEKYFEFEGLRFKTAEGAFQYKKLLMSKDTTFSRIVNLFKKSAATDEEIAFYTNCNGEDAFQAGQKIKLSDQQIKTWDSEKDDIMFSILKSKFSNDESLKKILLATGDVYLVEHNPQIKKGDHWTDGRNGFGDNMLGKLLMKLRKELGGAGEVRVPKELRDYWMFGQAVVSKN